MSIDPRSFPFEGEVAQGARVARRVTWDSRLVDDQTAFAALPGERMHGNEFVQQALDRGAPFVLTDLDVPRAVRVPDAQVALRAWARRARDGARYVVGITGSVGKTTSKSYAAAALGATTTPGNLNTLNAIACFLLEHAPAGEGLVVEMGIDRVGEMQELMDLVAPDVGVVTTIAEAHLEAFGTLDVIAREKGGILRAPRRLVGAQAARWFPGVPTYGLDGETFEGKDLTLDEGGASFTFAGVPVRVPGGRRVEAEAAVLGLALCELLGVPLADGAARVAGAQVPGGRNRVLPGPFTVIDDSYNASPLSVRAALDGLAVRSGRRVAVLGDMLELGPGSADLHREVGEYARSRADVVLATGEFGPLLAGAGAFPDRAALARAVVAEVRPGDTVLVKASRSVGLDAVVAALEEQQRALA